MRRVALFLLIAAGAGALLAGCSGAGAPADENSDVRALAQDNVDAAVLIASWVGAIYVRRVETLSVIVTYPDPNRTVIDTEYVDGTTDHFEANESTRSSVITTTFPDGTAATHTTTSLWSNEAADAAHYSTVYSSGATIELDAITYLQRPGQPNEHRGTATTRWGVSTDYVLNRTRRSVRDRTDVLVVTLPNETTLKVNIPTAPVFGVSDWPIYQRNTTGQFTRHGKTLNFTLKGSTADAWDTLQVSSDGTTGSFTLGEGMSGSGELRKDGQAIAALTWDKDGNGEVAIIDATYDLAPSAAAQDFQMANWAYRVSLLGPTPGF